MINTDKIYSILGKAFAAISAFAVILPALEGIDIPGIHDAVIQIVGGVAYIWNTLWRLRSKDSEEQTVNRIAEATAQKLAELKV